MRPPELTIVGLSAWIEHRQALRAIGLELPRGEITAIVGARGCGKSVFLRCLNRLHETTAGARVEGRVELDGVDVYGARVDPVALRRRVGMVFHEPNLFPDRTIRQNVLAGLRLTGRTNRATDDAVLEAALTRVGLWSELRERTELSADALADGDRQRLCLARARAVGPEVLLLDEPCAGLDPIATARIEDTLQSLRGELTIVLATHHPQQAARVADRCAFFLRGELIEYSPANDLFTSPRDPRTEDYLTGKFG